MVAMTMTMMQIVTKVPKLKQFPISLTPNSSSVTFLSTSPSFVYLQCFIPGTNGHNFNRVITPVIKLSFKLVLLTFTRGGNSAFSPSTGQ